MGPIHVGYSGWGIIVGHPELTISMITQEVGVVESTKDIDLSQFPLGSQVRIIPNHSCLTAACFPKYYVVNGDDNVIDEWTTCERIW